MSDLRIDPTTGDLDLSSGTIELVTGAEAIGQNIRIRLQMFQGEWHLDERQGMPYFQLILGKKYPNAILAPLFQSAVLSVAGVVAVPYFRMTFEGRALSIDMKVQIDTGEVLVFNDFIVGVT